MSSGISTVPLYIVQKSWFDGPHFCPSMDLPILFAHRSLAEQVASQSARAYAKEQPVRTILMGTEYAFATRGRLFWIRCIDAIVDELLQSIAPSSTTHSIQSSMIRNASHPQAFCVVTRQVIGGTGNPNSRRGSEHRQNCVVLTRSMDAAVRHVQATLSSSMDSQLQILSMIHEEPKTSIISDIDGHLQAWPDAHEWIPMMKEQPDESGKRREVFWNETEGIPSNQPSAHDGFEWEHQQSKKRAIG